MYMKRTGGVLIAMITGASALSIPPAQAQIPGLDLGLGLLNPAPGLGQFAQAGGLTNPLTGILSGMGNLNAAPMPGIPGISTNSGMEVDPYATSNALSSTSLGSLDSDKDIQRLGKMLSGDTSNSSKQQSGAGSGSADLEEIFGGKSSSSTMGRNREADEGYQQAMAKALEGELDATSATKVATGVSSLIPVAIGTIATDAAMPTTLTSGLTCGVGMATAATALATSAASTAGGLAATAGTGGIAAPLAALGTTGGAAGLASAAAPAATAAPKCIGAAGGAIRMAGLLVNAYEQNEDLPQLVDIAAQLDPDKGLGRVVWKHMPDELKTDSNKAVLKATSDMFQSLARVKFGHVLAAYGNIAMQVGNGNVAALAQLVPVTINLGMSLLAAGLEGISKADLSKMSLPGITDLKLPGLPLLMGQSKETELSSVGTLTQEDMRAINTVSYKGYNSSKNKDEDEDDSSASSKSTSSSKKNSDDDDDDDDDGSSNSSSSTRPTRSSSGSSSSDSSSYSREDSEEAPAIDDDY